MRIEISDEQLGERIYQLSKADGTNYSRYLSVSLAHYAFNHFNKDVVIDKVLNDFSKVAYQMTKKEVVGIIEESKK